MLIHKIPTGNPLTDDERKNKLKPVTDETVTFYCKKKILKNAFTMKINWHINMGQNNPCYALTQFFSCMLYSIVKQVFREK